MRRATSEEAETRVHRVRPGRAYCRPVKILIVSAFYPPENAIAAQRPLSWAREWASEGHELTVLTVRREDSKLPDAGFAGVRVLGVAPAGLFAFLRRIYRRNRRLSVPGGGESAALSVQSKPTRCSSLFSFLKTRGLLSSVRWPDPYDFWTSPALLAVKNERFDIVVSTFGPPAVLSIGWALKRNGQTKKWVIDFRDLWTENPSFRGFPLVRWFERRAENKFLKGADGVTTVSEPLSVALRKRRQDVRVFTNGFEGHDAGPFSRLEVSKTKVIRYTGSLYWPHQDPTPLFRVLSERLKTGNDRVRLEFYGPGLERIQNLAAENGISALVDVFESRPRDESLLLQRTADALLFLESPGTPGREGVLTGKLFEYLAAKLPILAVGVGPASLAGQIIVECNAGACVDRDTRQIEDFLLDVENDRVGFTPRGLPERFSRQKIAAEMLQFLRSLNA
jgi:glycosyltransferase involved in cell wall biosynthesis